MRLKGRGIESHRGKKGDHYVKVNVTVPRQLTERQRKLLTEFREDHETEGES
jgi:DnaJ-class molecular chaperone